MKQATNNNGSLKLLFVLLTMCFLSWLGLEYANTRTRTIGGTALVQEESTGLIFEALVDTGAGRCSINYLEIEIENEAGSPEQNIGKNARILIANERDERAWVKSRLIDYSHIRNVEASKPRYHIDLSLSVEGIQRKVSVTLKDRSHMKYPMLLGRNFLKDEFVVDVGHDSPDFPIAESKNQ